MTLNTILCIIPSKSALTELLPLWLLLPLPEQQQQLLLLEMWYPVAVCFNEGLGHDLYLAATSTTTAITSTTTTTTNTTTVLLETCYLVAVSFDEGVGHHLYFATVARSNQISYTTALKKCLRTSVCNNNSNNYL